MKWKDKFWAACGYIVDTAVDLTANTLDVIGSVVCVAGGAAFSLTYAMDETLKAAYYGTLNTTGDIDVSMNVVNFSYTINQTIPFQHYDQTDGGVSYNLVDYINPRTILAASAIMAASGTTLKLFGANIKQWQQGRKDKHFYETEHGVDIKGPSLREYGSANALSILDSLTYTFVGCAVAGSIIQFTGLIGSRQSLTYPLSSTERVNSAHYSGPVRSQIFPEELEFNSNITIKVPDFGMSVLVEEKANVTANLNVTYGLGLFTQSNAKTNPPVAIASSLAGGTYLISRFFSEKLVRQRDERIHLTQNSAYRFLIND